MKKKLLKIILTFSFISPTFPNINALVLTGSTYTRIYEKLYPVRLEVGVRGADWIVQGNYFVYPKTSHLQLVMNGNRYSLKATSTGENDAVQREDTRFVYVVSPNYSKEVDNITLYRRNTTLRPRSISINE